jgi:dolichol-phosphate mannosyltransferase
MKLSVVIPMYNEEENVQPMMDALDDALVGLEHELIFVDDGSIDETVPRLKKYRRKHVRIIQFRRNFGQTSAMAAGIQAAKGTYIAMLDGDLQNDPRDIPLMLKKLQDEKLDMVAGIRKKRKDGFMLRKIPSLVANYLIRKMTKVTLKDYGCTLKVFKAEIAKGLDLQGELHRFIPILAVINGAKMAQMDVRHHPRKFGTSKYGISRTLKVASDLLLMFFFIKYRQKPMHLFGGMGLLAIALGGLIETYLLILKIMGESIGTRPLFYVGILSIIVGVQLITSGFVAEILMRTYYGAQDKTPYVIANEYAAGKAVKHG